MVIMEWTVQNPGRRFEACLDYDVHNNIGSCNFFCWVDKPMTEWQEEVILHLMEERTKFQRDVETFKKEIDFGQQED